MATKSVKMPVKMSQNIGILVFSELKAAGRAKPDSPGKLNPHITRMVKYFLICCELRGC